MLNSIVHFSLRFRGIVIALACALLGYGMYSLTQVRYSVFPEFASPRVVIQTEAPALAPEQVELLVTQPIENAITGVPGIDSLRSGSVQGLSVITNQRIVMQTEGQSLAADQISKTVLVHRNGANVTLGDVATVVNAPAPLIGAASVMGQPAVLLMVDSQYGANALEVTRGLDQALAELGPALTGQGIAMDTDIFRPANFIETALSNVRSSLLIGAALIIVVLFLFLFNLRTAFISCTAIPLSLLTAVIVLEKLGLSLNTMTLGGLAIAIGEVVDDAVIDVRPARPERVRTGKKTSMTAKVA